MSSQVERQGCGRSQMKMVGGVTDFFYSPYRKRDSEGQHINSNFLLNWPKHVSITETATCGNDAIIVDYPLKLRTNTLNIPEY